MYNYYPGPSATITTLDLRIRSKLLRPFGLGPRLQLILPGDKSLRRVDLGREDTGAEAEQNITVNQGLDRVNCIR
ncbi:hypothetical protein EMCRGX_G018326 [Ephydatia muelleri]